MNFADEDDREQYKVVLNHDERYSLWPADRENALGWRDEGKVGTKAECVAYVNEVWLDMSPLSLRNRLAAPAEPDLQAAASPGDDGPDLVARLLAGEHPVEAGLHPVRTAAALRDRIQLGYLHVRFPNTRGGTELGVRLDATRSDTSSADFERGTGRVRIVGSLILDNVPLRCVADLDVATLAGVGRLETRAPGE